jgi:hypothetical protein
MAPECTLLTSSLFIKSNCSLVKVGDLSVDLSHDCFLFMDESSLFGAEEGAVEEVGSF